MDQTKDNTHALHHISPQDLLNFGKAHLAYIKPVDADGQMKYAIHSADGVVLTVLDDFEAAVAIIAHNDMHVTSVH